MENQVPDAGRPVSPPNSEGHCEGQPQEPRTAERRATRERTRLRRVGVLADFARAMVEQGEERRQARLEERRESRRRFDTLMSAIDRGNSVIESMVDMLSQRVASRERSNTILETLVGHVQRSLAAGELSIDLPARPTTAATPGRPFQAASPAHLSSVHREVVQDPFRDLRFLFSGAPEERATCPLLVPDAPEANGSDSERNSIPDETDRENRPPATRPLFCPPSRDKSSCEGKASTRKSHVLAQSNTGPPAKRERSLEGMEQSASRDAGEHNMGRVGSGRARRQKPIFDL
ncbi:uncharacterized protein LOC125428814 [Sphaerodactylus townsendi]|uniref:Uncharacterized protein n=1 Tax=Sphaerodactylus townsendi TaxID=933632 RepID=A0ACB8EFW1_9SAUR|nr:uncharacterized protein LOC125428814 [Sphaerodactylus townsendi]